MAYQLFDDWQDLSGGAQGDGKPAYQDLKNGVLTLPLLLISEQPGFAEMLAEVQAEGKVWPKHRQLIGKWIADGRVEAEVWRRIHRLSAAGASMAYRLGFAPSRPPLGLRRPFFERKDRQKKTFHC